MPVDDNGWHLLSVSSGLHPVYFKVVKLLNVIIISFLFIPLSANWCQNLNIISILIRRSKQETINFSAWAPHAMASLAAC